MTSPTKFIGLGLLGSLGLTFLILGCVVQGKWWTLLIFLFYGLTPLPLLFVRTDGYDSFEGGGVNKSRDIAMFFVAGLIVSTIAFPIFLSAQKSGDQPLLTFPNVFLCEFATMIFYTTVGLFMTTFNNED